jgi:hypothetical protein
MKILILFISIALFTSIAFAENANVPYRYSTLFPLGAKEIWKLNANTLCKYFGAFDPGANEILKLSGNADLVIDYTYEGKFNIRHGKIEENVRQPIRSELEDYELFFDKQRHKDLIVVWFDILPQHDGETLKDSIEKLNKYFFKRGYKRIMLLLPSGDGVRLCSDKQILNKP